MLPLGVYKTGTEYVEVAVMVARLERCAPEAARMGFLARLTRLTFCLRAFETASRHLSDPLVPIRGEDSVVAVHNRVTDRLVFLTFFSAQRPVWGSGPVQLSLQHVPSPCQPILDPLQGPGNTRCGPHPRDSRMTGAGAVGQPSAGASTLFRTRRCRCRLRGPLEHPDASGRRGG